MKKTFWMPIILSLALLLASCGQSSQGDVPVRTQTPTPEPQKTTVTSVDLSQEPVGDVLNIWCWNDEFQSRFNDYYPQVASVSKDKSTTTLTDGTVVNWIIHIYDENNYQTQLDQALLEQDTKPDDEKIDIFLIEADTALKYVDSPYTLDVCGDLGLTHEDLVRQYRYTLDIASVDGVLKGVSWQATPGLFVYRRSIALDVLGTQKPEEVQQALSNWDSFDAVAQLAAEKGYQMLSGYDDSYRVFSNNMSAPWVNGNTVHIDENLMHWVDQTKTYTELGYNNQTSLWSGDWANDQGPDGNVFGFFYSTWGINFTLLDNSLETPVSEGGLLEVGNGIYGDYAVCEGPQSYYWGGTWICGATGTDNKALIADIMRELTCNADIMQQITIDTQDYTNNALAMGLLAMSDFQSDFLGGQNHIALFVKSAPSIDMSNVSPYDQGLNESFQKAFTDYFDGTVDLETAKANFEDYATATYPELTTFIW